MIGTPFAFLDVRDALKELAASRQVPADLTIVYDGMHPLWGGSTFTANASGWLERKVRPRDALISSGSDMYIGEEGLLDLVRLLVEESAWEQRTPEAPLVPDESRPELRISLNGHTSRVWERYNDMRANDRLIRIKRWLESRFEDASKDARSE